MNSLSKQCICIHKYHLPFQYAISASRPFVLQTVVASISLFILSKHTVCTPKQCILRILHRNFRLVRDTLRPADYATTCKALFFIFSIVCKRAVLVFESKSFVKRVGLSNGGFISMVTSVIYPLFSIWLMIFRINSICL